MTKGGTSSATGGSPRPATTMLVLAAMVAARRPLSTYEVGLVVADDHVPPRPLSVVVRSLARDGYVSKTGSIGKRSGLWRPTRRGRDMLRRRSDVADAARAWLSLNANMSSSEILVLRAVGGGAVSAPAIVEATGLTISPVRTALRRLRTRGFVGTADDGRLRVL